MPAAVIFLIITVFINSVIMNGDDAACSRAVDLFVLIKIQAAALVRFRLPAMDIHSLLFPQNRELMP